MAAEVSSRWGIIYHPKQGVIRSHKRWEAVRRVLEEKNVEYDFVQSDGPGSVGRLARMLVQNGYRRIVVVGGDTALCQALNALMSFDESIARSVQLGVIPNGRGNDYASYWGLREDEVEQSVECLIRGRVRRVDVGYCRFGDDEPVYFLNGVHVGLMASIMDIKYKARRFWGLTTLTYLSSMMAMVFQRLEYRIRFRLNFIDYTQKAMTICIGNARGFGFTPNAVPYNGLLDVSVIRDAPLKQFSTGMWMLLTGKILNHKSVSPYRTRNKILFSDLGKAKVSIDGHVYPEAHCPMELGVLPEWIQFIIP